MCFTRSDDSSITEARSRFQRYRTMIGRHKVELLLFVLLWTTYAYFYQSTQQNEAGRFDQIRAVVQDHTLAINKYWWNSADVIRYPTGDTGPIYPNKAPGTTLLGALPFAFWSLLLKVLTLFGVPRVCLLAPCHLSDDRIHGQFVIRARCGGRLPRSVLHN